MSALSFIPSSTTTTTTTNDHNFTCSPSHLLISLVTNVVPVWYRNLLAPWLALRHKSCSLAAWPNHGWLNNSFAISMPKDVHKVKLANQTPMANPWPKLSRCTYSEVLLTACD